MAKEQVGVFMTFGLILEVCYDICSIFNELHKQIVTEKLVLVEQKRATTP